ncbi:MAG: hypothetical protein IPP51_11925 [Bacteroidetes bacterium]|nr:hypothetical protein [Bacteroidota bacterium]
MSIANFLHQAEVLYLCLFICLIGKEPSACFAQSLICTKEETFHTAINSLDFQLKFSFFESTITYCTDFDNITGNKTLLFHTMNVTTLLNDSFRIKLPQNIQIETIPEFAATENFILLQDDKTLKIHCFEKRGKTGSMYHGEIKLPEKTSFLNFEPISQNKFLLMDYYNHHPLDSTENISLGIYNAESKIIEKTIHPKSPGIAFSHLQNHYITIGKNRIALAEAAGNKIRVYDFSLKEIITLSLPESVGNFGVHQFPFETSPDKINPKELIELLKKHSNNIARIESLYYGPDDKLIAGIIPLHEFNSNRLMIAYDETTGLYSLPQKLNFTGQFCDTINIPCWSDYLPSISGNRLLVVSDDSFQTKLCLPKDEYEKRKNSYYETHDAEYIFHLYRINH